MTEHAKRMVWQPRASDTTGFTQMSSKLAQMQEALNLAELNYVLGILLQ